MKKDDQAEYGLRKETGELYMLNKKERILTLEILKVTLSSAAGRAFLVERFGKEGLKTATKLMEEMGVQVGETQAQGRRTLS